MYRLYQGLFFFGIGCGLIAMFRNSAEGKAMDIMLGVTFFAFGLWSALQALNLKITASKAGKRQ